MGTRSGHIITVASSTERPTHGLAVMVLKGGNSATPQQTPMRVAAKPGHNLGPQTHSLAYKKGLNRAP